MSRSDKRSDVLLEESCSTQNVGRAVGKYYGVQTVGIAVDKYCGTQSNRIAVDERNH